MKKRNNTLFLAGDIGGTKTNLGLFKKGKTRPRLMVEETYPSGTTDSLEEIIDTFLKKHPARISKACFGIAGPVQKGHVKTTNLPWVVSGSKIKRLFGWDSVSLLNDLVATALAIPLLTPGETFSLTGGKKKSGANIGLVAPGTGLGMALLVGNEKGYIPVPSEGGHADFGPNSLEDISLWKYLRKRFGHVSAERVLSGPGLFNIYNWLKDSGRYREPLWLNQRQTEIGPARAISEEALKRGTPIARAALKTFVANLGSVAGNFALTGMTTGGIYLGGGIPPKIIPMLDGPLFAKAFVNKGRYRSFLESIPVKVILNDKAALIGAAFHAMSG